MLHDIFTEFDLCTQVPVFSTSQDYWWGVKLNMIVTYSEALDITLKVSSA
jgi:hypothetical protein